MPVFLMSPGTVLARTCFVVDGFPPPKAPGLVHFLTHAHKDHTVGLERFSGRVYCSEVTRDILATEYPGLQTVRGLEMNVAHVIPYGEEGETCSVTLIDANHCPGACMFLFDGSFGRILHTGDFRFYEGLLTLDCLRRQRVDDVYLDSTFAIAQCPSIPTKETSIGLLLREVDAYVHQTPPPQRRIYLQLVALSGYQIIHQVCRQYRSKIFYDTTLPGFTRRFKAMAAVDELADLVTNDPSAKRQCLFHMSPMRRLGAFKKQREASEPHLRPLYVSMSTMTDVFQKYGDRKPVVRAKNQRWILFGHHASFDEQRRLVAMLRPPRLVPTVEPMMNSGNLSAADLFADLVRPADSPLSPQLSDPSAIQSIQQANHLSAASSAVRSLVRHDYMLALESVREEEEEEEEEYGSRRQAKTKKRKKKKSKRQREEQPHHRSPHTHTNNKRDARLDGGVTDEDEPPAVQQQEEEEEGRERARKKRKKKKARRRRWVAGKGVFVDQDMHPDKRLRIIHRLRVYARLSNLVNRSVDVIVTDDLTERKRRFLQHLLRWSEVRPQPRDPIMIVDAAALEELFEEHAPSDESVYAYITTTDN